HELNTMLPPLRCLYLPHSPEQFASGPSEGVLGTMHFAQSADPAQRPCDAPFASVAMPTLLPDGSRLSSSEIWIGSGSPSYHRRNGITYSLHDEFMFGSIQLDERDFNDAGSTDTERTPLHQAAEVAYRDIFALMDELGYPHVLRFWNY